MVSTKILHLPMKLKLMQSYLSLIFYLCEMMKILQQQNIKKRIIQMFIYIGPFSHQYYGREEH